MKAQQFTTKSKPELEKDLVNYAQKLRELRFDASFNKLKNTKSIAFAKKDVARIMTLLNKR